MSQLTYKQRRVVVGLALALLALCAANYLFQPGLFAPYEKRLMVVSVALLFIVLRFVGPTPDEVSAFRESWIRKRSA